MNEMLTKLLQSYKTTYIAVAVLCLAPLWVSYLIQASWGPTGPVTLSQQWLNLLMSFSFWFAGVLMCITTLKDGPLAGLYMLPVMLIPAAYAGYMTDSSMVFLHAGLLKFGFLFAMAVVLGRTTSWGLTLDVGCLVCIAVILGYCYFLPNPGPHWTELMGSVNETSPMLRQQLADGQLNYFLIQMSRVVLQSWLLDVMTMLLIARWIQARLYNPGGLGKELIATRSSFVISLIAIGCIVYASKGNATALYLLIVAIWPPAFTAIALMHVMARKAAPSHPWLVWGSGYVVIMLTNIYAIIGLMLVGIGNSIVRLFSRQGPANPDLMKS